MAIPLRVIRAPRWTQPALVSPGDAFAAVVKARGAEGELLLRREQEAVPLDIVERDHLQRGLVMCQCQVPAAASMGMYDLLLQARERTYVSPSAVSVMDTRADALTLLHTSDWHILERGVAHGDGDNTGRLRALVQRINAIRPDLVICTGDLVSRYGAEKELLPRSLIRWQARRVQELGLELQVPIFVIPGNHDLALESSRESWRTYMGGPWDRPTDDYSLDLGPCHMAMLDGFAHYNDHNVVLRKSFAPSQMAWLYEDMAQATASRWRLLFIHYDYTGELLPKLGELGVDMLFYGHSNRSFAEALDQVHVRDGHLLDWQAYRLVRVSAEDLTSETVAWADLG